MSGWYARFLPVWLAVGVAGGLAAVPVTVPAVGAAAFAVGLPIAPPAGPQRGPPDEGPAGPPALLPGGRVAAPPLVTAPRIARGCPPAAALAARYAPGRGRTVALTFDDGPGASTGSIIAILRSMGVAATFFNIGENEAARPRTVAGEARMGYLLGNRTWDHATLPGLSAAGQAAELYRTTAVQEALAGVPPCAFRPPGGGRVHAFGIPWHGSDGGRLPAGVRPAGLAA